ncbi:molybdopterin-dependent oxidoreductase [bacterium]|nr:molybdopterin-dependent oxidoreductase [bacterium]
MVTVTVNGRGLMLPKGKNLLQALLDVGHYVPHYCYQPALSVAGNCRLCLVEIEGRPKPEISCNMVVTDGLKIRTDSELIDDCRKGMMEFLLMNHPLDCPICDRGGECMLQRYSMEYGWGTARTVDARRRFVKPQFDPLIDIERNRCIMCTRCVRFCDEVGNDHVMGVFGHGSRNYIGTFGNGPVSNPFSGNVIDLCPVGCLTSKPFRFEARPWELRQTLTTPRHANGIVTAWTRGGRLLRVTPPARRRHGLYTIDEDTTRFISNEVRFGSLYTDNEDRLLEPLARGKDGKLVKSEWEPALDRAAEALKACKPGEACFIAGERSTNEEFYLLGRLARAVCHTPYIDWRGRFVSESAAQAAGVALSASDGDFDLLDKKAYQAMLIVAAGDLYESAPDISLRLREGARLKRTRLGLIDSRVNPWLGDLAETAWLEQPEKIAATLIALAEALEKGKDPANAPQGMEKLFKFVTAEHGLLVLGLDSAGGAIAPELVPAALRILRALGVGWHFLPVTAARNAKGGFVAGAQSDRVPTGRMIDPELRVKADEIYGSAIPADPSPAAPGLLEMAAQGKFKVLVLHRCDELVHHPRRELIEKAIAATPMVIAIDVFPSWITERAAIVFPGSMFMECDGSMTDIDGTLQRMSKGCRVPGNAQEEWRIIELLGLKLGDTRRSKRAHEIFADLARAWGRPDVTLDSITLKQPGPEAPQGTHNYFGVIKRPDFKLHSSERPELAIAANSNATSGRSDLLTLWWIQHSQGPDHLGSRSSQFDALRPRPRVELSTADAARLGLKNNDWVLLEGGSEQPSQVLVNPTLAEGVVYGAANVLGLRLADGAGLPHVNLMPADAPAAEILEQEATARR